MRRIVTPSILALSAALLAGGTAGGDIGGGLSVMPVTTMPGPLREVGYDQRLGAHVPLDLPFRDEAGRAVRLGRYFGGRPVILVLAWYKCPMLCDLVLDGVATALKPLAFDAGKEFDVVVASFNPRETPRMAAGVKRRIVARYGRSGSEPGFHFLTGAQPSIDALTRAVGFRYVYDKERGQYAHPAGLVILTPAGKVSRYLFGIDFPPRDVRLGILESSEEKVGSVVDQLLLYCYHYDPAIGRYSAATLNLVRAAAVATVIGLASLILILRRREVRRLGQAGA